MTRFSLNSIRSAIVCGAFTAGLATACAPASENLMRSTQPIEIETLVSEAQSSAPYPGLAVSVRRGDDIIYEAGHGYADLESLAEASPDTVFQVGSITKSFTSLLIAQLVAEGEVDLDAPVSTYLPDFSGPAASVPVRRLMNHSSGLLNYTAAPDFPHATRNEMTQADIRAFFEDADLLFEPGSAMLYSNSGTYTLGLIVEAVTGQTYDAALQSRVLDPLNLDRTFWGDWRTVIEGRAEGYVRTEDGFVNAPVLDADTPFAAGALLSTVQDVQDYLAAVHRDNAFGDSVRDILYTRDTLTNGARNDYALGALVFREFAGRPKIAHAGDIDGYSAYMAYYPEDDVSIVVVGNVRDVAPTPVGLEQKIARLVFNAPRPNPSNVALSDDEIADLIGDYDAGYMRVGLPRVGIVATDGGIAARFGGTDVGGPAIPLIHLEGRTFIAAHDDEMAFIFSPEDGQAADLALDWLGGQIPFSRPNAR